jgi:hypothetical protein
MRENTLHVCREEKDMARVQAVLTGAEAEVLQADDRRWQSTRLPDA